MCKREISCLRCQENMVFILKARFQLGETGWFLGDLPNLLAGSMELSLYSCPQCGKVEFFQSSEDVVEQSDDAIAQVSCKNCGKQYDMDYPRCPFCKSETVF